MARCDSQEVCHRDDASGKNTSEETFPGFLWAKHRHEFMFSDRFPNEVSTYIGHFRDQGDSDDSKHGCALITDLSIDPPASEWDAQVKEESATDQPSEGVFRGLVTKHCLQPHPGS